jgi:flagellar basal-body rod modification protein FlgD
MPGIGNPNRANNPFGNIKMGPRKAPAQKAGKKQELGRDLNKLAGIREDSKFVDRKEHNKMDKDAFLKLLSNQLSNQDPFKPVDQKKFAADLAQFSQLEQLANLNTKFDKAYAHQNDQAKYIGASFLGKEVHTKGTTIDYDGESRAVNLPFYMPKPAKQVIVRIFDSKNNMTKQIDLGEMGQGAQSLIWDGVAADNVQAVKDVYRFEVRAYDKDYNQFMGETRSKGVVKGVDFENGETILTLNDGKKVFLRDVHSFSSPSKGGQKGSPAAKNPALKQQAHNAYNKNNENPMVQ